MAAHNEYNFDHPDAFDFELLKTTLQRLKEGRMVEVPIYNFVTHRRESRTVSWLDCDFYLICKKSSQLIQFFFFFIRKKTMYGANVIIFEGILTFYNVDVLKVNR